MKGWLVIILFFVTGLASAQDAGNNQKPSVLDKMYFGGGLGFSSGTNSYGQRYTFIGFYPIVGYRVTEQFSTGGSFTYQYYNYPDVNQSITQYGVSPFVRYNFGQLFLYSEYMILNSPSYDPGALRRTYNRMLVGAGYQMPIGQRSSLNAMALYDVIYDPGLHVFTSPWVFRVFFAF